jgi:hypothetical protein
MRKVVLLACTVLLLMGENWPEGRPENFGYVTSGPPPSGHYQEAFLGRN